MGEGGRIDSRLTRDTSGCIEIYYTFNINHDSRDQLRG